ncbi:MAG: hypothetical protein U0531_21620 [Dehalococcoidia bacterium]
MNADGTVSYGEIRCLLCGRCLADVESAADGRVILRRSANTDGPRTTVRMVRGRLHCARCGGRAFVEWDLMTTTRPSSAIAA